MQVSFNRVPGTGAARRCAQSGEALALLNNTVAKVADKHLYGRFRYVPGIRSFILSDHSDMPAQALRPRALLRNYGGLDGN
jgi:hypothetical protein